MKNHDGIETVRYKPASRVAGKMIVADKGEFVRYTSYAELDAERQRVADRVAEVEASCEQVAQLATARLHELLELENQVEHWRTRYQRLDEAMQPTSLIKIKESS